MFEWLFIVLGSMAIGIGCGAFLKGRKASSVAILLPWIYVLSRLLYLEYYLPYSGGGASLWPIGALLTGTFAALIGWSCCQLYQRFVLGE